LLVLHLPDKARQCLAEAYRLVCNREDPEVSSIADEVQARIHAIDLVAAITVRLSYTENDLNTFAGVFLESEARLRRMARHPFAKQSQKHSREIIGLGKLGIRARRIANERDKKTHKSNVKALQILRDWLVMGTPFVLFLRGFDTEGLNVRVPYEDLDEEGKLLAGIGDGHADELIISRWSLRYNRVLEALQEALPESARIISIENEPQAFLSLVIPGTPLLSIRDGIW
jgi:hypothetical protein